MNIYIVILSCHNYRLRRASVRLTWMKRLLPNMTARFVVGAGPVIDELDVVQLPTDDGWDALAHKMRDAFRYALRPDQPPWDYLFKCDDDTYLVPERLESAVIGEYVGRPWEHDESYVQGAGYFLSRRLVEIIANAPDCPDPAWGEDGWVGFHARANGAWPTPCWRFTDDWKAWPTPENDLISAHCKHQVELMFTYHARYVCATPTVPTI